MSHIFEGLREYLRKTRFRLSHLPKDQQFVIRSCRDCGIDKIDDDILNNLIRHWADEAEKHSYTEEQLLAEISDDLTALSSTSYCDVVGKVADCVKKEASEKGEAQTPVTTKAVAINIVAEYHLKAMKTAGVITLE